MSLIETPTFAELHAHYKAVRARLWAAKYVSPTPAVERIFYYPPSSNQLPEPPAPEPDTSVEAIAARWRDTDERLFGGRVSPKAAIYVTAAYFGLSVDVVCGKSRKENIARARQSAIYIMYTLCRQIRTVGRIMAPVRFSFPQMATHFGIDHATVIHTVARVISRLDKDEKFVTEISEIMALLQRSENK
jgi:Bacterial dnaA protein helix-turn-helix